MNWGKAVLGGLIGAVVVGVVMALASTMGMQLTFPKLLGTMVMAPGHGSTLVVGWILHLCVGMVLGLIYGGIFEAFSIAKWSVGLAVGLIHAVLAGLLVAIAPLFDSYLGSASYQIPLPGPFMARYGAPSAVAFIVAHLLFGLIVATIYAPTKRVKMMEELNRRGSESDLPRVA